MAPIPELHLPQIQADGGPSQPAPATNTSQLGPRLIAVFYAVLCYVFTAHRAWRDSSEMQILFGIFDAMVGFVAIIFRHGLGQWQLRRWEGRKAGLWIYMGEAGAHLIYLGMGAGFLAGGLTLVVSGSIR
jgi:hypothetical protein